MCRPLVPPTPQQVYRDSFIGDEALEMLTEDFERQSAGITPMEGLVESPSSFWTEYMQDHGFLEIPLSDSSDYIEHIIHPIFRRENFDTELSIAGEAYEALLPALALVTKWITTKEFLGWWIHLLYGIETELPDGKRFLAKSDREDDLPRAYRDLAERWVILSQMITFYWTQSEKNTLVGLFSRNGYSVVHRLNSTAYPYYPEVMVPYEGKIGLSSWYLYHLMSPEVRRTQGPCERMRLQFLIAKTIGHELAHAFYSSRNRIGSLEPYIHQFDPVEEVGLSWQAWQLGTPGMTCNWSLERLGVVFSQTHNFCLAWPRLESPVKMAWIESWFLKSTSDHIEEAVVNNMLKAPCAIGQPEWFIADRYVDKVWGTCVYQNGKMTAQPSTNLHLPISSPPEDMCVET